MPKISNLRTTSVTATTIDCAWRNCSVGEAITLKLVDTTNNFRISEPLAPGAESGGFTALSPNRLYEITVRVGNEESTPIYVTTEAGGSAPTAPSGVIGTPVNASTIAWTFTDNSNDEDGFEIQVIDALRETIVTQFTIAADTTTVSTSGLTSGRLYGMRVRATSEAFGPSDWSDYGYSYTRAWDSAPIGGSGTIPPPPVGAVNVQVPSASIGESSALVTWNYYGSSATSIKVRLLSSTGALLRTATKIPSATEHTWINLAANTDYETYVEVCNEGGCTSNGVVVDFHTHSSAPSIPTAPVDLTAAEIGPGHVLIQFDASATGGDTVSIWRDTVPTSSATEIVNNLSPLATSYIDDDAGLVAGNTYRYWATATNISGTSDPSNTDDVTITAVGDVISPPYSHTLVALDSSTLLATWEQSGTEHYSFRIEISDTADTGPFVTAVDNIQPFARAQIIDGLTANTQYWTRVIAQTPAPGESDPSNVATATTLDDLILPAPTGPTITSVEVSGATAAQVRWQPTDTRVASYSVRLSVNGGAYSNYATGIAPYVTVQDIVGLDPGTPHNVIVRATSDGGTGDSSPAAFTTGPRGQGPGFQGSFRTFRQYMKALTKDDDDQLIVTPTRPTTVTYFRGVPPDATNGPFPELYIGGTLAAGAGGDTGVATARNYQVAVGQAVEIRVRGTGTSQAKMVLTLESK